MTDRELFEILKERIEQGDCRTEQVSAILSEYKNSGGKQETAESLAEELVAVFSGDEELQERAYDIFDIVTGWCPPALKVWEKKKIWALTDGMRFEDEETGVVFNHFSFCEFIKHIMTAYAGMSYEEADDKVKNSFLAYVPRTLDHVMFFSHELDYHWAMLLAHGDMYWTRGIPSDYNGFSEEYLSWAKAIRQKYNLKESYLYYDKI
ncbi:hypothetical protein HYN59_06060 [Flavobacterium album]|uniref:Uncharacterized protein n=1 Tax=Flavobacterium album TaxID=2175091 RepID=A0A2S1QWB5_9FLAO|nr:hypothetical protein [Flavobacterium album]AWH84710.1 hypothetical protein HYN59_06060 [Flavobacterium album]